MSAHIVKVDLANNQVTIGKMKRPIDQFKLQLPGHTVLKSELIKSSLKHASNPQQVQFFVSAKLQDTPFAKEVAFQNLELDQVNAQKHATGPLQEPPYWAYFADKSLILPTDYQIGEGVLLPKSFQDNGVLAGDRGYLSYQTQTTSSLQEMRIPIFVAGFYDPGLIPNSGRLILAPKKIIATINAGTSVKDSLIGNGINVWFDNIAQADAAKTFLAKEFHKRHISPFWEIKTYKEYEYAKDFIEQLSSDRVLFTLIAVIIIMVACTNIISMLILLVSDKKKEIGILQAMGASRTSIAFIFGGCGLAIGLISSAVGTTLAYFTLKNINSLIALINKIQGRPLLNSAFFGDHLPTSLNKEAFAFAIIATSILSILSGLIPAIKAMRMNPSEILKSEH